MDDNEKLNRFLEGVDLSGDIEARSEEIAEFGGCPVCCASDGYLNIGPQHWFRCDWHKTKWYAGADVFPSWRDENLTLWAQNAVLLKGYEEVKPILPPDPDL